MTAMERRRPTTEISVVPCERLKYSSHWSLLSSLASPVTRTSGCLESVTDLLNYASDVFRTCWRVRSVTFAPGTSETITHSSTVWTGTAGAARGGQDYPDTGTNSNANGDVLCITPDINAIVSGLPPSPTQQPPPTVTLSSLSSAAEAATAATTIAASISKKASASLILRRIDCDRHTALDWACYSGNLGAAKLLIANGLDPWATDGGGKNCLHWAASQVRRRATNISYCRLVTVAPWEENGGSKRTRRSNPISLFLHGRLTSPAAITVSVILPDQCCAEHD